MKPNQQDLIECDQQRHEALLAADTKVLEELFTDDLIYLHSTGVIDDKKVYLDGLKSGRTKYLAIDYQPDEYRFAKDFALILGRVDMKVLVGGEERKVRALVVSTWRFINGRWKMMIWQATTQV